MRVLGVVRFASIDKHNARFARIEPLVEVGVEPWRSVERSEFPTEGRVFWPLAHAVKDGDLLFCDVAPNVGGNRDQLRVTKADPAVELLDGRVFGEPARVWDAITCGGLVVPLGVEVTVLCETDLAVGPLRFRRSQSGNVEPDVTHPDRIAVFRLGASDFRRVIDGTSARLVLPAGGRVGQLVSYVDWDPPERVLRRSLLHAIDAARRTGGAEHLAPLEKLTKKFVEELLVRQPPTPSVESSLHEYRLRRAAEFFAAAEVAPDLRKQLVSDLLSLPSVKAEMEMVRGHAAAQAKLEATAHLQAELATELQRLAALRTEAATVSAQIESLGSQMAARQIELSNLRDHSDRTVKEVEAALETRLRATLEKPAERLAEVSILRALMQSPEANVRAVHTTQRPRRSLEWTKGDQLTDKGKFLKDLSQAFRAAGVTPAAALRIHASMISGLIPIIVGAGAVAALTAYSRTAGGGRMATINVAPTYLALADLVGTIVGGTLQPSTGGLMDVATSASDFDGLSVLVLEGLNRAPVESYLLPLLQLQSSGAPLGLRLPLEGHDGVASLPLPPQLRIAALVVAGPTTLPLSLDIWNSAVCIEAENVAASGAAAVPRTEVPLTSELFEPSKAPAHLIDDLVSALPGADGLRRTLERFAAGLARFQSDETQLRRALLETVVVPWCLTLPLEDDREEALKTVLHLAATDEDRQQLIGLARRLRRRLG